MEQYRYEVDSGMAYYGKQNYLVAISCLKKALYLDPFEMQINFNLGTGIMQVCAFLSISNMLPRFTSLRPRKIITRPIFQLIYTWGCRFFTWMMPRMGWFASRKQCRMSWLILRNWSSVCYLVLFTICIMWF